MNVVEEENSEGWIDLAYAWEELAATIATDGELVARQKALLRGPADETPPETQARLAELDVIEDEMKAHLLNALRLGNLEATGRDASNGFSKARARIAPAFFDSRDPKLEINWIQSTALSASKTFIDIRVRAPVSGTTKPIPGAQYSKRKSKRGRPRSDGLDEAVEELLQDPDFRKLKQKQQCARVRETLFDDPEPREGYGDGAIKNRLRDFEKSQKS